MRDFKNGRVIILNPRVKDRSYDDLASSAFIPRFPHVECYHRFCHVCACFAPVEYPYCCRALCICFSNFVVKDALIQY